MKSGLGRPPFSAAQSTDCAFTAAIADWNAGNESFAVRSAQYAPDCHPLSRGSSTRRKLKNAATFGWQYASRIASSTWVPWSGAGLVSVGAGDSGSPPAQSGSVATFSVPVYHASLPGSRAVWNPASRYQIVPGAGCAVPLKASHRL